MPRPPDGWEIFYEIPASFVQLFVPDFALKPGAELRANCYKCGDLTPKPHYLSWNPVTSQTPDFHRPQVFGQMIMKKRVLSLFLAMALLLSMAVTATAAESAVYGLDAAGQIVAGFATLEEAISNSNGSIVTYQLNGDLDGQVISKDIQLDLNGHDLTNVTVPAGVTLYGLSESSKPREVISTGGIVPSGRISIFSTQPRLDMIVPLVIRW